MSEIRGFREDSKDKLEKLVSINILVIVKHLPPNRRRYLYGDNESPGPDQDLQYRGECVSIFTHEKERINRGLLSVLSPRSVLSDEPEAAEVYLVPEGFPPLPGDTSCHDEDTLHLLAPSHQALRA
jgi:hypothetical protein